MAENRAGSILAVDFGNVHTRAVLIDLVDGTYRPVGYGEVMTTAGFPHGDVNVGMVRALHQISHGTGRQLLHPDQTVLSPELPDRSGVDSFLVTTSIGRPMRTVMIGLTRDMSVASALRAVAGTYVQVVETLTLEDDRDESAQINAIILSRPDLFFLVGGTEAGAQSTLLQMASRAALAMRLMGDDRRRLVLFAGNSDVEPQLRELFGPYAIVLTADNVRPTSEREQPAQASAQLASAYDSVAEQRGAGFDRVAASSALGVLPTAQSYGLITRYLARVQGSALALDVGSAVSTLSAAIGDRSTTTIRNDIGLGHSAGSLIEASGFARVQRWLPFVIDDNELLAFSLNKSLRPGTVPENLRELYLEHALMRAGAEMLVQTARPLWTDEANANPDASLPPFRVIIGAGAVFANTGRPGLSAMLLLDALQPQGMSELLLDGNALIPALGALARVQQAAFVQLLEAGGIIALGTCFSVSGQPRPGKPALRVRITLPDGEVVRQEVMGGTLWMYPLSLGVRALIDVRVVGRGITIGGKRKIRREVIGGTAGIIFDARGRPLPLALTAADRAGQMPTWYAQATGDEVRPINPEWLEATARKKESSQDVMPPRKERSKQRRGGEKDAKTEQRAKEAQERKVRERFHSGGSPQAADVQDDSQRGKDDIDELRNLFS